MKTEHNKTEINKTEINIENVEMNENNEMKEGPYTNYYNLDYVFIGQFADITDFYYYAEKNHLISAAFDLTVKIWDLTVFYLVFI